MGNQQALEVRTGTNKDGSQASKLGMDRKIVEILVRGDGSPKAINFINAPHNKPRAEELATRFHLYWPKAAWADHKYIWHGPKVHAQLAKIYRSLAMENPRDPQAASMMEFADSPNHENESGLEPSKRNYEADTERMKKSGIDFLPLLSLASGPLGKIAGGAGDLVDFIDKNNPNAGAEARLHEAGAPGDDAHGVDTRDMDPVLQRQLEANSREREETGERWMPPQAKRRKARRLARQQIQEEEAPSAYEPAPLSAPPALPPAQPVAPAAWGGAFVSQFPEQYGAGYS